MANWSPDDLPLTTPSAARMYDYFLGGYHNFEIDRRAADAVVAMYPDFPLIMRANRAFLRRAVRFLVAQGIDQFLDLGSGIPTVGNVHEIAQAANPAARVVYVDADPVAVAHSEAILRGNPRATVLRADIRQPEAILAHPTVRGLLDIDRPLAVLLVAVLHFITDDAAAAQLVQEVRDALPPGGYLVLTHGASDAAPPEAIAKVVRRYDQTSNPTKLRSRGEVAAYFEGLQLVEPGLVLVPSWRPDGPDDLLLDDPVRANNWGGVGKLG